MDRPLSPMPHHVAIIMDGNGRWANARFLPRAMGHRQGAQSLKTAIQACREWGIPYLSVYVFSTENWTRPNEEVSFLMSFLGEMLASQTPELIKNDVRIRVCGNLDPLSAHLKTQIQESEGASAHCNSLQLNLLINYGGRDDIIQAVKRHVTSHGIDSLTPATISQSLYTAGIPDPDMVIRTGGDIRISNFLLWQSAYSELFFLDILWPDFNKEVFHSVVEAYRSRERRFGGVHA